MTIYVNSITNALFTSIASDATIVSSGVTVCAEDYLDDNYNNNPAVFIYWAGEVANPNKVGRNPNVKPFLADIQYLILMQCGNYNQDPPDVVDDLNKLFSVVYSAVSSNVYNNGLQNTVCNWIGWEHQPYQRDPGEDITIYHDSATFTFQVEV